MPRQKACKKCLDVRPITVFSRHPRMKDGRLNVCNRCRSKRRYELETPEQRERKRQKTAAWRAANPERHKESRRKSNERHRDKILAQKRYQRVVQRYGITPVDLDRWMTAIGNRCEICFQPPGGRYGKLFVDHNHATGEVRGLLCNGCNRAIGFMSDDPLIAEKVAAYLRKRGHRGKVA